jgi:alkylation response protein AidB-like acyl-CoA dehydrogenase
LKGGGAKLPELPEKLQNTLYHDVSLPEEVKRVRAEAREFAEKEVEPQAYAFDSQEESAGSFPTELFSRMAVQGLFQIPFSTECGGRGLKHPMCAAAAVEEELAYASNSIAAIYDCQCILPGSSLLYASKELQTEYLVPLAKGEKIACFAVTEPEAGSDLSAKTVKTTATRRGERWIINGRKRFIVNAPVADFGSILCLTDGTLSMFVVDLHERGVRVGEPDRKMGIKACLTADICFDDVEVPQENLIWGLGKGLHIALGSLTRGRIVIAATGVGMAQAAFDVSVDYMKKRELFGKKVAQHQYWRFKLAEWATEIEAARNLCYKAAYRYDQGVEFPEPETAMAKYFATQVASDIAGDAVQIFGGYGFMSQLAADKSTYKVEQIYRDCATARIYEGANEVQKWVIARQIFGRELTL